MAFESDKRQDEINRFLNGTDWAKADRIALGQDASTRRYIRLMREDGTSTLLMDAPRVEDDPCPPDADEATRLTMGWNASTRLAASRVDAFVALSGHLNALGLSAPTILRHDAASGFALIEDFGSGLEYARLIERGAEDEIRLYEAAAETLATLHAAPVPKVIEAHGEHWPLLDFDSLAIKANADLFIDWLPAFDTRMEGSDKARAEWEEVRDGLIAQALAFPRSFTLRDYHAENLLWLKDRSGVARVGLLDFQDAVHGWDVWDFAMLTQDARRPVSEAAAQTALLRYLDLTGKSEQAFQERLAIVGA